MPRSTALRVGSVPGHGTGAAPGRNDGLNSLLRQPRAEGVAVIGAVREQAGQRRADPGLNQGPGLGAVVALIPRHARAQGASPLIRQDALGAMALMFCFGFRLHSLGARQARQCPVRAGDAVAAQFFPGRGFARGRPVSPPVGRGSPRGRPARVPLSVVAAPATITAALPWTTGTSRSPAGKTDAAGPAHLRPRQRPGPRWDTDPRRTP